MSQLSPYLIASSRLLERMGYYGLRTIVVVYMVGETLNMERKEAFAIYGFFSGLLVLSQILGAIFGDLVVGNKKAIILGAVLQALGAFCLSVPGISFLYVGLALVSIGGGLYSPNILALFGKEYLNKTKLLDSGFTLLYVIVSIAALLGTLIIGKIGETYTYKLGFIVAGILVLLSIIPLLFSKETDSEEYEENKTPKRQRGNYVVFTLIIVGAFWMTYEMMGFRINNLKSTFRELLPDQVSELTWHSMEFYMLLVIGIIVIFLWASKYFNQLFKLTIGFLFATLALALFFFIPSEPSSQDFGFFVGGLLGFTIAEIIIAPLVYSVIVQYGNLKYLAILMSLIVLPGKLFSYIYNFLGSIRVIPVSSENSIALIIAGLISIILLIVYIGSKKKRVEEDGHYLDG